MEKADIFDTVDKMAMCFGPEEAMKVMMDILRKMKQNDLAKQLEKKHKQAQAEGNMKTSVTVGDLTAVVLMKHAVKLCLLLMH
ncbi:LRR and PYD domains-containing 3-like protein [Labeo rohita]|uniref:LRR and PYD domains-containing 3-like protein n=1 Tax=Labeo rohita TaxID=84645 RepID=A0A498NPT0_LABRO|nr:LRR and PYD domains-containing 3-like protein [Labeo rohita]RXN33965.1 LRR and PYD domains-containing 3-like protein [Labeo rohita]